MPESTIQIVRRHVEHRGLPESVEAPMADLVDSFKAINPGVDRVMITIAMLDWLQSETNVGAAEEEKPA